MREIKFRAWDKKHGIRPIANLNWDNRMVTIDIKSETKPIGLELERKWEDIMIEQYTGLKDKHGKEIYEGDILRVDDYVGCVSYGWKNIVWGRWVIVNPSFNFSDIHPENELEVIGNIHENPGLLGGEVVPA